MSKTPIGRVSFPKVFEAESYQGGEPKFSITMLFDDETVDLSEMKAQAEAVARERWSKKLPAKLKSPFRSGTEYNDEREEDGKDRLDGYDGHTFIRFISKSKPCLVDQQIEAIDENDTRFYAGVYAVVSYSCFAYEVPGNKGVSFGLNNVQLVKSGEPFESKPKPEDEFEVIENEEGVDEELSEMFN